MSTSTSTSKKSKIVLNGRHYKYGDESHLNKLQIMHLRGELDLYAEIPQSDGGPPLPPVAEQWKEDFKRRHRKNVKSSRRR